MAEQYAQMLVDPCYSSVANGFYPGEKGLVQRVARNYVIQLSPANTAAQFAYYPGANMNMRNQAPDATTNFTTGFTKAESPGITYFDTNGSKFRSLGSCVEVWSNAPALSLTGTSFFGVVPASSVQTGFAANAEVTAQLLPDSTRLTTDKISVKWVPGAHDVFWHSTGGGTGDLPVDSDDRNCINMVFTGLPPGSSLTFRVTNIIEWTPNRSVGITQNSANTGAGVNPFAITAALHQHNPKWNISITPLMNAAAHVADSGIKALAAGVKRYGPRIVEHGMGTLANATIPLLLG
jgi:hypothetical protein